MNGRATQWILVVLALLGMCGGAVAWMNGTFETKGDANFKYQVIEKKLDQILEEIRR